MLGYESEKRFKNLLVAVGESENLIERARQRLCEIRDMHPHSIFQRLDRDMNDNITSYVLLNFLRDNKVYHSSEPECRSLLNYFDSDEDGRLSYHE